MPIRRSPDNWEGGRGLSINDSVEVVGGGQRNRGSGLGRDGFLWDGSLGTTPITVNSLWNELTGINDNGLAVGWGQSPSFVDAFTWDDASGTTLLGKEGGTSSYAFGINDLGQVVGSKQYDVGGGQFGMQIATLWSDPLSWIQIGDLSGGIERSEAVAINEKKQVVGWGTTDSGEEAFYWDELAGLVSLADLVDDSLTGWTLIRANAINDSGWIGGAGINPQGGVEGFVLIPEALVPVPATVGLILFGLVGIGSQRWILKKAALTHAV